jgi:hypothetical protein
MTPEGCTHRCSSHPTNPDLGCCNADFNLTASVTGQRCEWVVPPGTVD